MLGTLTYSMDGEVASTAVVVALLNLFQIVGSFAGGAYLDARGPRLHFALLVIVMLAVDAFCIVFGGDMSALTFGAACLGFSLGFFEPVSRSYPAYLTADAIELKRINSALSIVSNTGVVVGPLIGGAIASMAPTRAVFAFMGACVVLAVIPAAGFRPVIGVRAEGGGQGIESAAELADAPAAAGTGRDAGGPSGRPAGSSSSLGPSGHPAGSSSSLIEGIRAVFSNAALSFLFWAGFLSYLGYGALDPLESLYYRDVLQVCVDGLALCRVWRRRGGGRTARAAHSGTPRDRADAPCPALWHGDRLLGVCRHAVRARCSCGAGAFGTRLRHDRSVAEHAGADARRG